MSALEQIIKWAQNDLTGWQSDAVRRLLTQDRLIDSDKAEILAMLKEDHGLGDSKKPAPRAQPVKRGQISGVPQTSRKVILKAIKDLQNVNAIPNGSNLPFGHEGLTVIYGETGTGKSGYARVLKKACIARDTKEKILPNAFGQSNPGPAKAIFKVSIDGDQDIEILWQDGQEIEGLLSNICVFDSKSARVIVDENNEVIYLPYGAHVFGDLVDLMQEIRSQLENENPKLQRLEYSDIPSNTKAGQFIAQLNLEIPTATLEEQTQWIEANETRLVELQRRIAEAEAHDPLRQAQMIRNIKDRINEVLETIERIDLALSESKVNNLRTGISRLNASEKALALISQETLANEPLAGVGEHAWQLLYNAAKEYSTQAAYPTQAFPVTAEDSLCVLCMQPLLGDAKKRMLRFREFMEQSTKEEVDSAQQEVQFILRGVQEIVFSLLDTYKDAFGEIRYRDEQLAQQVEEYLTAMQTRAQGMIQAVTDKEVHDFSPFRPYPKGRLAQIVQSLEDEAQAIEKAANPEELNLMKSEKMELEAQKLLASKKQEILNYLEQFKRVENYNACIAETDSWRITYQGRQIISEALTPDLQEALRDELKALNVNHLQLNLKPSGIKGEMHHQMELKGCNALPGANLTDILSEGEQHVVAIAGFLAELKVAGHQSPIVLDDPVCSLDRHYREKIAERLAREAASKQVIVFTHDIAFLLELETKAGELDNVFFCAQTVKKDANGPGKCIDGLPWDSKPVRERIDYLNAELDSFRSLHSTDSEGYNRKAGDLYALLREAWEAAIEKELLNETIVRFGNSVQTRRLKSVEVTDSDYKAIDMNMAKCSNWMIGHDKSKALDVNRPSPDDIKNDIRALGTFIKGIHSRRSGLWRRRGEFLEPKKPEVG
jgi:energy-coupling factor transporter ATP-binding protein EcfA2